MTQNKWIKFHSTHSSLRIDQPTKAGETTNLHTDWSRASETNTNLSIPVQVCIDGKPLNTYAEKYHYFNTDDDVGRFFKDILMKKMEHIETEHEKNIITFFKDTLHQGGLLYPVTSALAVAMVRDPTKQEISGSVYAPIDNNNKVTDATVRSKTDTVQIVNIIPCKEGIIIQEHVKVKNIIVSSHAYDKFKISGLEEDEGLIAADEGSFLIEAQGEIKINCLKNVPELSIGFNAITYHEPRIKKVMDNRSLAQILIDFIERTFGFNKVNIIEVAPKQETDSKSLSMR
jgi:hypothetical protein